MKKRIISALCLCALSVSFSAPAFAQGKGVKGVKETKTRPVITASDSRVGSFVSEIIAFTDGVNGAIIEWNTSFELGNVGFYVYRSDGSGKMQRVNDSMIGGSMVRFRETTVLDGGASYSAYDPAGKADSSYYVETYDKYGRKAMYGPVSPMYSRNLTNQSGYNARLRSDFKGEDPSIIQRESPAAFSTSFEGKPGRAGIESASDPVNQKWVAAQPGVKIKVNKDGLFRVSRASLQSAGFNVAAPPANWQLYLNGVEQRIIVEPAGDYIEFFGHGIDIQSTDSRIYYLLAGAGPGKRITSITRRPFAPGLQTKNFQSVNHYEPRMTYISYQIVNGDLDNWFGPLIGGVIPVTRTINLKDVDTSGKGVTVKLAVHGLQEGHHSVRFTLNGVVFGTAEFDGIEPFTKTFNLSAGNLLNGDNSIELIGTTSATDNSLLDYVEFSYPRLLKANQNSLEFVTQHMQAAKVTGFNTPNVRVFDLFYPDDPQLIVNAAVAPGASGFDVSIPSGRSHPMFAVNENSLQSPVSVLSNTPSTISGTNSTADMVIISHGNFIAEANAWATYRRSQGLIVDVLNVEDVYDEFDYGLPTPIAVKNSLQYLKNSDPNLKYVLFVGDATYDPRNYLNTGFNDFIPTKFVNTGYGEVPSDEALGDSDNDAVAEMAIGRLTVRTAAEVPLILGKVTAFESVVATSLANRGVLFVADEPIGWDFAATNRLLSQELPKGTPHTFIDLPSDPDPATVQQTRDSIVSDLNANNGRFIINYSGHGSIRIWSSRQIFRQFVSVQPPNPPVPSELERLTNSGSKLTLFLMLTCLNGNFADPTQDNLAEALVKAQNGGAPTSWASTGETTPNIQEIMALRFFHIVGEGIHPRLGDAIKEAKQNAPDRDVPLSWVLIGDPALKIK